MPDYHFIMRVPYELGTPKHQHKTASEFRQNPQPGTVLKAEIPTKKPARPIDIRFRD